MRVALGVWLQKNPTPLMPAEPTHSPGVIRSTNESELMLEYWRRGHHAIGFGAVLLPAGPFDTTIAGVAGFAGLPGANAKALPSTVRARWRVHGNSREYVGETHVYAIRGPNGVYKNRAEHARRARTRWRFNQRRSPNTGLATSDRRNVSFRDSCSIPRQGNGAAIRNTIDERIRQIYGQDALPGNATNG